MLKFTRRQRGMIAEKLLDIANIAAGAMIFGQFVSDRRFSAVTASMGVGVRLGLVVCAIALSGEAS